MNIISYLRSTYRMLSIDTKIDKQTSLIKNLLINYFNRFEVDRPLRGTMLCCFSKPPGEMCSSDRQKIAIDWAGFVLYTFFFGPRWWHALARKIHRIPPTETFIKISWLDPSRAIAREAFWGARGRANKMIKAKLNWWWVDLYAESHVLLMTTDGHYCLYTSFSKLIPWPESH